MPATHPTERDMAFVQACIEARENIIEAQTGIESEYSLH